MLFMREKKNITRKLLEAWYNLSLCSYTRQNTKFLKKVIILQQSFISSHFSFFNKQPLPLSLSERRGILQWITRCCGGERDDKKSSSSSSSLTSHTESHHLPCYWTRWCHINFRVVPSAAAATAKMRHHQDYWPEYSLLYLMCNKGLTEVIVLSGCWRKVYYSVEKHNKIQLNVLFWCKI